MFKTFFLALMIWPLVAASVSGVQIVDTTTADFTTWNLSGSAFASTTIAGGYVYHDLQLTAPGVNDSNGSAFAPDSILLNFNDSFEVDFRFFIPAGAVLRGDGLTVMLSDTPSAGGAGSDLGYGGSSSGSIAFAVDTFNFDGQPVSPSLQILQSGDVSTPLAYTETGLLDDIRDPALQWIASLVFTPSGSDDEHGDLTGTIWRPDFGLFTVTALNVDMSIFGNAVYDPDTLDLLGHDVYYGFTASNGLADDGHFITSAVPIPEPAGISLLALGSLTLLRHRRAV